MAELRWIPDQPYSERIPFNTRANVGEVLPEPPTPLAWDISFANGGTTTGWYDCATERFGLSTRFEWLGDEDGFAGWNAGDDTGDTTDVFSLTGTADYALTNSLMLRGEVRWDTVRGTGGEEQGEAEFFGRGDAHNGDSINLKRDQVTAGVEIVYEF